MEQLLQVLKANPGEYVSGEQLARLAGITRAGIWKQINQLRELGYLIESTPRRGYKLLTPTQAIHPYEFKSDLATCIFGQNIEYHSTLDSTNLRAKLLASRGAPEGTLVIAEQQTQGRGRMGRLWSAKAGLGLWFSLILRPQVGASELAVITIMAAVALARAVYQTTGIQLQVKWPNDLLYQGRKLVGILAELNGEMERVNYLILGIGINIYHTKADFPVELQERATSIEMIQPGDYDRKIILQRFLQLFEASYQGLGSGQFDEIINYARRHSATLGQQVTINQGFDRTLSGVAADLDWDGSLWLKEAGGKLVKVYSGELST